MRIYLSRPHMSGTELDQIRAVFDNNFVAPAGPQLAAFEGRGSVASDARLDLKERIEARFEESDVYDWLATTAGGDARFDVVFSSYGALPWLRDVTLWAQGIAGVLEAASAVKAHCTEAYTKIAATALQVLLPTQSTGLHL